MQIGKKERKKTTELFFFASIFSGFASQFFVETTKFPLDFFSFFFNFIFSCTLLRGEKKEKKIRQRFVSSGMKISHNPYETVFKEI